MSEEVVQEKENLKVVGEHAENTNQVKKNAELSKDTYLLYDVLFDSIQTLYKTTNELPGKIAYAFNKNIGKIQTLMNKVNRQRQELIKECCKLNENGYPEINEEQMRNGMFPFVFNSDDHQQKFYAEERELLNQKIDGNFTLHKVDKKDLLNLTINPAQNPNFNLVVDYLGK